MQIKEFTFNFFGEITRILWENPGFAVIVDPGCCTAREKDSLYSFIEGQGLKPCAVLLTHAHFDHVTGVYELQQRYGIPVYMDPKEEQMFGICKKVSGRIGFPIIRTDWKYTAVKDGEVLDFGGMKFEVISTPGHSPGSVCYLNRKEGILLSGDTLFAGSIGRTDLEGGDYDSLILSIMEKLVWLDGSTRILPGHGPESTIGIERVSNPFLEPFNEKEELEN
ncbi:MAG: MBL fold metallo-hydrolase [Bacteroidales bacterium]|nr:MBL fold metallo-hydrolase [Bacteroidales bacterium]